MMMINATEASAQLVAERIRNDITSVRVKAATPRGSVDVTVSVVISA